MAHALPDLVDMLERDVLGPAGTFRFVTVGPAGFIIDLTRERQHLRTLSAAARTGRLEFKGPASPAAEAAARLVSVESVISGLATRPVRRPSWSWGALLMSQANSASHGKPYAATRSQHESL